MSHHHAHSGSCSHHHPAPKSFHGAFVYGIALNCLFIAAELIAGFHASSLSLIADAVHNLSDVMGLGLAWLGYSMAKRSATARYTMGYGRMSIYATVLNGAMLLLSAGWIMHEAWERYNAPQTPMVGIVAIVAVIGIVINFGTGLLLMRGQHDINIKGAMLHMFADAGISAGVAISALVIGATGWLWIDPLTSLAVAILILWTTWPLFLEGLRLAMDGIPAAIDPDSVRTFLTAQPGVTDVQELRIWALSTTKTTLSAHIITAPGTDAAALIARLHSGLQGKFGLTGVTLQLEDSHNACL